MNYSEHLEDLQSATRAGSSNREKDLGAREAKKNDEILS